MNVTRNPKIEMIPKIGDLMINNKTGTIVLRVTEVPATKGYMRGVVISSSSKEAQGAVISGLSLTDWNYYYGQLILEQ